MAEEAIIGPGYRVTLHYRILLEDGMEADSSFGGEPLAFTVGDNTLLPALEKLLHGLRAGDRENFVVPSNEAYGERESAGVQELPREVFADMTPEPGQIVAFTTPAGDELPGAILEVTDETVRVDLNHPLAGRTLRFEVEVLGVEKG